MSETEDLEFGEILERCQERHLGIAFRSSEEDFIENRVRDVFEDFFIVVLQQIVRC